MGELPAGAVFAGYRIDGVAGRGGMGVVYRARQRALDREVALKVVAPWLFDDDCGRERFVREAQAAGAVDHPNVVPVHEAGEADGAAYLVMRYVRDGDLERHVRVHGPLAPGRAARVVAQIASALDAAHAAGLVHRDVKPANVLLEGDHAYLSDFGLTRHIATRSGVTAATGGWVGTLDYVAPEQIRGQHVDARADVYGLGGVLHFALTGSVPFPREGDEARLWAHLNAMPPTPSAVVPSAPRAFDTVIARALAKDPDDRFASAGELGRAALAAADGRALDALVAIAPAAPPAGARSAGRDPSRRSARIPVVTAALLVAAGVAVAVLLSAGPGSGVGTTSERAAVLTLAQGAAEQSASADAQSTAPAKGSAPQRRAVRRPATRRQGTPAASQPSVTTTTVITTTTTAPSRDVTPTTRRRSGAKARALAPLTGTPRVVGSAPAGPEPAALVATDGNAWVAGAGSTLARIDTVTLGLRPGAALGGSATDLVERAGALWIAVAGAQQVTKLSATDGKALAAPIELDGVPDRIDAGAGAIWVAESGPSGPDRLVEIDPETSEVVERAQIVPGIADLRADGDSIWVLARDRRVVLQVSAATRQVVNRFAVGRGATRVDVGSGFVWVTERDDNRVLRIDARTGARLTVDVPAGPTGIVARPEGVWVACTAAGRLVRIDPRTGRVVADVPVGKQPTGVFAGPHAVWATDTSAGQIFRLNF